MNRTTSRRAGSAVTMLLGLAAAWPLARPARADVAFAPAVPYPVGGLPIGVTVADVDGDGALDVISANSSGDVSLLFNEGDGTLAPEVRLYAGGGKPRRVAVGDIDGDGDADLVAAVRGGRGTIAVFLAESAGVFAPAVQYGPEAISFGLTMTDLDGDEDLDVAVVMMGGVFVFRNAGDGTFSPAGSYAVFDAPIIYTADLAAADVDGDGRSDLIVVNSCGFGCAAAIAVMINAGDGTFLPPAPVDLGVPSAGAVRADDLDGDGDADLAIVDCVVSDSDLVIAVNDGAGAFSALSRSSMDRFCAGGSITSPEALAIFDVDTDGAPDVVTTSYIEDEVRVLVNQGDFTFDVSPGLAVGDEPVAVATGDLDGDGRADVVTADRGLGAAPTVSVLINQTPPAGPPADLNGDGTIGFADLLLLLAAWGECPGPPDPCPADLDGDGEVGFADLLMLLAGWSG